MILISCVVAMLATPTASAQSISRTALAGTGGFGNLIWQGLWQGSNFDLSSFGFHKIKPVAKPAPLPVPVPVTKPALVPPTSGSQSTYAALGDSIAAGLGLPGVANPVGTDTQCGRSPSSYPYTVASKMNLPLNHVACSGATVGDLFTRQGIDGPNIMPQLDAAFASGTPGLITMTGGANDAHWAAFIHECYITNCANQTSTFLANSYLVALQTKLYIAYSSIDARSSGQPPTVVVTGYYNPLSASCIQPQSSITTDEITWLTAETTALNQTIANVSSHYGFVKFAPVDFSGHDICSSTPWVQGLSDAAPFHPTAAGQQVIAQSVLRSLGR